MKQIQLLPLNILPISLLHQPLNILPISHLLLPLNILPISHLLLLLLLDVLPISHQNLLLLLQLIYPKIPRNRSTTQWSKTKWKKEKVNALSDENNTNQKRAVSRKTKTKKQRRKKPIPLRNGNGRIKKSLYQKEYTLETEALVDLDHGSTHLDIIQTVTGMNEFLKIIVMETNKYAI